MIDDRKKMEQIGSVDFMDKVEVALIRMHKRIEEATGMPYHEFIRKRLKEIREKSKSNQEKDQ